MTQTGTSYPAIRRWICWPPRPAHRVLPAYVGAKEKSDAHLAERYQAMLDAAPRPQASEDWKAQFEAWWEAHGQYCRSGGGAYEKTFAYRAWEAATKALQH